MKDKPAFPRAYETNGIIYGNEGMTLREYYAGLVLAKLADPSMPEEIARMSVKLADALIAELQKEQGE